MCHSVFSGISAIPLTNYASPSRFLADISEDVEPYLCASDSSTSGVRVCFFDVDAFNKGASLDDRVA